jgi:hypothetical protein
MSNQMEFLPIVAKYWLYQLPFSLLYIAGAVLVFRRGAHAQRFGQLVLAGCVGSLILNLGLPALQVWYMRLLSTRGESLYTSGALDAFGVVTNLVSALALALVVWAAFVDRSFTVPGGSAATLERKAE